VHLLAATMWWPRPPGKGNMTAEGGIVLVGKVFPLIVSAIKRGTVKPVGAEDPEELISEATAIAARTLDSCESRGKPVSPNSLAYYAIQALKSGRRSCGGSCCNAMSPGSQLDSRVALCSMDEQIGQDPEADCDVTLHDCLANRGESADQVAARRLDWPVAAERLNCKERYVVQGTALETPCQEMARRLKVSTPRITQMKWEIAGKILEAWGEDALQDAVREPSWHSQMRAATERKACRAERRAALK